MLCNLIWPNTRLKGLWSIDPKVSQRFCQEHRKSNDFCFGAFGVSAFEYLSRITLQIRFDCIFRFLSKSWPGRSALGFAFFPRPRPLYQQPPLTLSQIYAPGYRCPGQGVWGYRAEVWVFWGTEYRIQGLMAQGSGFGIRVQGLRFRVEGWGLRVEGWGLRVEGWGLRA